MAEIQYKLTTDNSQFLQGTLQADQAQAKLATGAREFEKDSKKAYDEAGKGAKKYDDEVEKTVGKTESLRSQSRKLKEELARATDPKDVERLARQLGAVTDQIGDAADAAAVFATDSPFEAVGNSIGSVGSKLRNLDFKGAADQSKLLLAASKQITFKESLAGMKDLGTTLLNIGKALLTNPLFLIGSAVAIIVANFDALKNSGGQIGGFFQNISKFVSDLKEGLSQLTDYIGLTNNAFMKLNEIKLDKLASGLEAGNAKFDRYINLLKAYGKETTDVEKAKQDFIIKNSLIQLETISKIVKANGNATDEQKKQIKELREAAYNAATQKAIVEAQAQQKILENQKKANEEYKKNREALNAALLDLRKRSDKAEVDSLSGAEKLAAIKKLSEQELNELRASIQKKGELTNKNFKFSAEQEAEFAKLKTMINREYFNGLIQLEIDAAQKKAQIAKNKNDTALANLELENVIVKNGIEAIKASEGASAKEIETLNEEKHRMLLKQELSYQLEKEKLIISGIDKEKAVKVDALTAELVILETRTDAISKARVKAIEEEISAINLNSELAKAAATSSVQNIVSGIEAELNKTNKKINIDFGKLLALDNKEISVFLNAKFNANLNEQDVAQAKQALSELGAQLKEIMNAYFESEQERLNTELNDNQKRIDQRNENIKNLEENLAKEKDLMDKGYANNTQRIQNAIKEQQKAKDRDLANEKRLKEEKKKLAKQQLDIDTLVQASNLVVAVTKIFETYASVPYVAALLAAGMIGSFVYTKTLAYEAVNKNNFAKGVVDLQGPGTETSDDIPSNLSKGESVVTAKGTKLSKTLLKGLNANDNLLIQKGIEELLKNTGVTLPNFSKEINFKKMKLKDAEMKAYFSLDNSGLEKRLNNVEDVLNKIYKQGDETKTILNDGTVHVQKGNSLTIIRKKA